MADENIKEDCGCGIWEIIKNGKTTRYIGYCPKHKAAPDMHEALRDVLLLHGEAFDTLHRGIGTATFQGKALLAARQALAKADGNIDIYEAPEALIDEGDK
uniref:Uncharacterized protein n=1 Tax=viral metagenome TaxID=1070528 RepID=A0A6M3LQ11_9ZZZZ